MAWLYWLTKLLLFLGFFGFLYSVSSVSCSLGCYCKEVVLAWTLIEGRDGEGVGTEGKCVSEG